MVLTFNDSWLVQQIKQQKIWCSNPANIVADVFSYDFKWFKKCMNENGLLIISGIFR